MREHLDGDDAVEPGRGRSTRPSENVQTVSTRPELPVRCCTTQAPAISTESDTAIAASVWKYKGAMKNPGWTSRVSKIR